MAIYIFFSIYESFLSVFTNVIPGWDGFFEKRSSCFLCSADYIDWIPLGLPTQKVYRLSHKAIELPLVVLPICYILFPPCSIALSRWYSGALDLILFDTLIQLIVAPPYVTLIRWRGWE